MTTTTYARMVPRGLALSRRGDPVEIRRVCGGLANSRLEDHARPKDAVVLAALALALFNELAAKFLQGRRINRASDNCHRRGRHSGDTYVRT